MTDTKDGGQDRIEKARMRQMIDHHEGQFFYSERNYQTATTVGSYRSAERALVDAANHASILSALYAMLSARGSHE